MKRTPILILVCALAQVAYGNYAFYSKVESTCEAYRFAVDRSAMEYRDDVFRIELESRSRNDFEMAMLVAFAAVGQAEIQQRVISGMKSDFKPLLPKQVEVTVLVPVERVPTLVTATASGELVEQLARGEIETTVFMQKIKDTIETH
ncbi:MAG: hypothetical protein D6762_00140 [Candidatus Neomarinimicrobiota bacterium]|nr:MAG: hypothetical protein D6762_00140 [Candidatus Neomarinimicrobiota bacterium]